MTSRLEVKQTSINLVVQLSAYAKKMDLSYRTAWNYLKEGKLNAYQTHTGMVIEAEAAVAAGQLVVASCSVSSSENKGNLESQEVAYVLLFSMRISPIYFRCLHCLYRGRQIFI